MTGAMLHEGFNLLPHRLRKRREMRRHRLAILAVAAVTGCAAVGALAGWDALQRARLDERRWLLEASLRASGALLDEHARLVRAEAERRRARQNARPLAAPRDRFIALLEALANAPEVPDVALQRVTQRTDEVELAALAPDSQAAAAWLKRLESLRGVQSVEVVEMKRRVDAPGPGKRDSVPRIERYEFTALVRFAREAAVAASSEHLALAARDAGGGAPGDDTPPRAARASPTNRRVSDERQLVIAAPRRAGDEARASSATELASSGAESSHTMFRADEAEPSSAAPHSTNDGESSRAARRAVDGASFAKTSQRSPRSARTSQRAVHRATDGARPSAASRRNAQSTHARAASPRRTTSFVQRTKQ